jgi:hypothetical protein
MSTTCGPHVTIFLVSKYIHHGCRFNLIPRNMLVPTYYESNAQFNRKKKTIEAWITKRFHSPCKQSREPPHPEPSVGPAKSWAGHLPTPNSPELGSTNALAQLSFLG